MLWVFLVIIGAISNAADYIIIKNHIASMKFCAPRIVNEIME